MCCPHAFKKPVNIAVVLKRPRDGNEWSEACDFVGHTDPVVCASFNPRTFRRAAAPGSDGQVRLLDVVQPAWRVKTVWK